MARLNPTSQASTGLTGPQREALEALLSGSSVPEAAKLVGRNRTTVWKWLQEPAFYQALKEGESTQMGQVSRALGAAGRGAVETLVSIKDDPEVPAAVRARAASDLLARLLPVREMVALEERLSALEKAQDRGPNGY